MKVLFPAAFILAALLSACSSAPVEEAGHDAEISGPGFTEKINPNLDINLDIFTVHINQDDPAVEITKDPAVPIRAKITISDGTHDLMSNIPITIEGRGNSTWYYSYTATPRKKLPYKIIFALKTDMMGMGEARKWLFLANRFDKSLMKNMLVFDLAQGLSFRFTPRSRVAELYLNGDYKGVYQVTDQVEADESVRVITGTASPGTDTEPGFLLEWDNKAALRVDQGGDGDKTEGVDFFWLEDIHEPFVFKNPGVSELDTVPGNAARVFIGKYLARVSAAILSSKTGTPSQDNYKDYIDVASFYDYFIVNELAKNHDAAEYSSIFVNKPKTGKLALGPVWDFDGTCGWLKSYNATTGWIIRDHNPWLRFLIKNNAEFSAGLKARWNQVKALAHARMIENIAVYEAALAQAAARDEKRWGELAKPIDIWNREKQYPAEPASYADVVAYVRQWLTARYEWMDVHFNDGSFRN